MAHTDRDHMRYVFKHHRKVCVKLCYVVPEGARRGYWLEAPCVCDRFSHQYWQWPESSAFHADCRREERRRAAAVLQRARAGHLDWDDLTFGYGRPYYW